MDESISIEEFEQELNKGNRYTGYVRGMGKVFWEKIPVKSSIPAHNTKDIYIEKGTTFDAYMYILRVDIMSRDPFNEIKYLDTKKQKENKNIFLPKPDAKKNKENGPSQPMVLREHQPDSTETGELNQYQNFLGYVGQLAAGSEDVYSSIFYNHKIYTTTKGVKVDLPRVNVFGKNQPLSNQQKSYLGQSRLLKGVSVAGTACCTYVAADNIYSGNAAPVDYVDVTVGAVGTGSGTLSLLGLLEIPIVGEVVAGYFWVRFWFDLGQKHGPSTWHGANDDKWFE